MEKVKLGKTSLVVTKLGIGCAGIGNLRQNDGVRILKYAIQHGVSFFDVGRTYGAAEEYLGIASRLQPEEIVVSSKSMATDRTNMVSDFQRSLDYLGRDRLDIYQLHSVESHEDLIVRLDSGVVDVLQEAVTKNQLGSIGISTHSEKVAREAIALGIFDILMFPCNIGMLWHVEPILSAAHSRGLGVIAMTPLAKGILIGSNSQNYLDITVNEALSAVLSTDFVDCIIPGVKTLDHLKQNIIACNNCFDVSEDQIREYNTRVSERLGRLYCRSCKYCCPCPVYGWSLDIPRIIKSLVLLEILGSKELARACYEGLKIRHFDCGDCCECENRCPFSIPIRELLRCAADTFNSNLVI